MIGCSSVNSNSRTESVGGDKALLTGPSEGLCLPCIEPWSTARTRDRLLVARRRLRVPRASFSGRDTRRSISSARSRRALRSLSFSRVRASDGSSLAPFSLYTRTRPIFSQWAHDGRHPLHANCPHRRFLAGRFAIGSSPDDLRGGAGSAVRSGRYILSISPSQSNSAKMG